MTTEYSSRPTNVIAWRKSSYSDSHGGDCVEIAEGSQAVWVRDSKDRHGPQLVFDTAQWGMFVAGVRGRDAVS